MAAVLERLDEAEREALREGSSPKGSDLMKATLTDERFSDPGWIFERKLDGIRCLAIKEGGEARLRSRNDLSLNARYPEIAEAIAAQPAPRFAVDGEVVAFDGKRTSFARLARRGQERVAVFLYLFDVLWIDGVDVRRLPLRTRKGLLAELTDPGDPLRLVQHRNEDGEAYFEEACRKRWEGLIAKRADSAYASSRTKNWLKFKCEHGQELVIGGYTAPKGSRTDFGALLVGYYDGDELRYAGKVGTGFTERTLAELGGELRARSREEAPFADAAEIPNARAANWVAPELVAEIGFTEWTRAGRLRHPRFLGLRDDKPARKVVRES